MTSHDKRANDGKVRLATFLHPRFLFCCVPADVSRHFSLSAHFSLLQVRALFKLKIWIFPWIDHVDQVSCDWILCCDWYALHGAGRQAALWPNPRPFPSVRNRVWPRETIPTYRVYRLYDYVIQYRCWSRSQWLSSSSQGRRGQSIHDRHV